MDYSNIFKELFYANGEEEVYQILNKNALIHNDDNWFPYGGKTKQDRYNFGTFESQQANPIPALIEKITNSIDSLLMLKCKEFNIDPKGIEAPQSMEIAIERFYNIKNGDFSEISKDSIRNIAEEIQVIADGDKQTPDIIVYDNGEGQLPENFQNTFLSLLRGNKNDIPFVQGKYNMGSTGAVIFCGINKYQLIISKLNKNLNNGKENPIGFTLVRRHPLAPEEEIRCKSTWYEYLIFDGKIPYFQSNGIDLNLYNRKFISGTIIKMYSYGLPRGTRSSVVWDLWRELNQYLYHPALPFIVYERRGYDKKTPSKPVLGNKIRLILDERAKKEKTITTSIIDSKFGKIPIEIHVFKSEVNQIEFINNKSVIYTVNGQVQGFEKRNFISSELNFQMLRDHLLIRVDCTNIKTSIRTDLFKSSRDRLNQGALTEEFLDKIISLLKNNDELKRLNLERKNKIFRENTDDKKLLEDILTKIPLQNDLLKVLSQNNFYNFSYHNKTKSGNNDSHLENKSKEKEKRKLESNRFPSIFKLFLKEDTDGKKIKSIPLNGKGILNFETDVEDEYFFRPKDKGELKIGILSINDNSNGNHTKATKIEDLFDVTISGPTDNSIRTTFEPKQNINVNDEIEVNAKLTSPSGDLECIFYIKIIDPKKEEENENNKQNTPEISLPIPIKVFKTKENESDKTWEEFNWSGDDMLKLEVEFLDKASLIQSVAINMDSFVLQRFISKNKINGIENLKLLKNKYFLSIYWHSIFLYKFLENIFNNNEEFKDSSIDIDEIISQLMKFYGEFLLSYNMINEQFAKDYD